MFQMAKERGYLATGPSAAGMAALIKQVAALGDDRVTINAGGVRVKPRPVEKQRSAGG
jgi:type IV secretory pathway protease TraF